MLTGNGVDCTKTYIYKNIRGSLRKWVIFISKMLIVLLIYVTAVGKHLAVMDVAQALILRFTQEIILSNF